MLSKCVKQVVYDSLLRQFHIPSRDNSIGKFVQPTLGLIGVAYACFAKQEATEFEHVDDLP